MDKNSFLDAFFGDVKKLWDGEYKIPWNEPEFSKRMLKEHLSQDHDLASRREETINKQVNWIDENYGSCKLLDIGCGPGFYINRLADIGYSCCGIDFSPASIEYAWESCGDKARFVLGDIRKTDFGNGYNLVSMIFGEFNVFSSVEIMEILQKAYDALVNGGTMLAEVQSFKSVKASGEAPNNWYKAEKGLFSDSPHVCLTENCWFEEETTAMQKFTVIDVAKDTFDSYRSTTKAWTKEEFIELFSKAGFKNVQIRSDWPSNSDALFLISADKD